MRPRSCPSCEEIAIRLALLASLCAGAVARASAQEPAAGTRVGAGAPAWQDGRTYALNGMNVTLSRPVLVARSKGYLWFPTLVKLVNGDCMAVMSNYADQHVATSTALVSWSHDSGLSWTKPIEAQYGDASLRRPGDDELLLPYYLKPLPDGGFGGPYQLCPKRKQELRVVKEGVTVTGLPRKDRSVAPELGLAGFVFNGQTSKLKNGSYLATLYGYFEPSNPNDGTTREAAKPADAKQEEARKEEVKRYSLIAVESPDGVRWTWKSTIADEKCPLPGKEGPCESALCRLADGRLFCVYRMDSGAAFGHSYSADDGKTWSEPAPLPETYSVQPSLAVLKDGMVALSGGRPGLFLWLNADKTGKSWQKIDVAQNHDEFVKDEPIAKPNQTSAYTEIILLDDGSLLYIYDRIPHSWSAIPADSTDTNSVWVVRATVQPSARP